jgi:hypothetical protein
LKDFDHKHIIRLYDVFEEPQHYYMITEKMTGGELFDRIVQKSYYNEREARDTCEILLQAIHYCHKKKVAHRDLKPENLLLTSGSDDSDIKIADFGFAKRVKGPKTLTTQCGTVSEEESYIEKLLCVCVFQVLMMFFFSYLFAFLFTFIIIKLIIIISSSLCILCF